MSLWTFGAKRINDPRMAKTYRYLIEQLRPFSSTILENRIRYNANSVSIASTMTNLAIRLEIARFISNNSGRKLQIDNMPNKERLMHPYTVVVEGNIGSGKV